MWSTEQSGRRPLVARGRLLLCTEKRSVQPAPMPKGRASELWPPSFLDVSQKPGGCWSDGTGSADSHDESRGWLKTQL